jgi:hypothetical protein
MKYLVNSFSLQMLQGDSDISIKEISRENVINILYHQNHQGLYIPDFECCVGHQDTANVLTKILGYGSIEMNRINISLNKGDIVIVAQLTGGRLPEGAKELPEGYSFKFFKVTFCHGLDDRQEEQLKELIQDMSQTGLESWAKEILKISDLKPLENYIE